MGKRKRTNNDLQNTIQKLKMEHHEPHLKPGVNSGAPITLLYVYNLDLTFSIWMTYIILQIYVESYNFNKYVLTYNILQIWIARISFDKYGSTV
jgi:hypothetical protein